MSGMLVHRSPSTSLLGISREVFTIVAKLQATFNGVLTFSFSSAPSANELRFAELSFLFGPIDRGHLRMTGCEWLKSKQIERHSIKPILCRLRSSICRQISRWPKFTFFDRAEYSCPENGKRLFTDSFSAYYIHFLSIYMRFIFNTLTSSCIFKSFLVRKRNILICKDCVKALNFDILCIEEIELDHFDQVPI